MEISKGQRKVLLTILLIVLFIGQGCVGIAPITPSPTVSTLTQTPSPKPTDTKTSTPDDVATANFIETASVNDIVATVQPEVLANYPSPDGKWRVEVIRYDCINYAYQDYIGIIAYEHLKIINLKDGNENIVDDQLQNCDGIGGGGLKGLYWSPNNRYFYYTDWREGFPETCGNYAVPAIYRLDTLTQESRLVGGGHISPDQTKLAMWEENEIVIWDLDKGEVGRVSALKPNLFNGQIWWSSNGQSILYLQTELDCAPNYGKTYITRLDLTDFSQSPLAEYDAPSTEIAVTPVPSGVFALLIYPPLIMNYDTSIWKDESQYADIRSMSLYFVTNLLQALSLETCHISVAGPIGDFLFTPEKIQLGALQYEIITFTDALGSVEAYYIENNSLVGFNYEKGTSKLLVSANPTEWSQCKALAEKVLSTLHIP